MANTSSDRKRSLLESVDRAAGTWRDLALKIHAHPELGLQEEQASKWLADALESDGARVTRGAADMPTAFIATRGGTSDAAARPVIAYLAEYDALRGLGHACGHNLICTASCLAATALAQVAGEDAQVRVIGCPAEETSGGKIPLVERGAFGDVDFVLMAHPMHMNFGGKSALGLRSVTIEFHGTSSHAAALPEGGVNALDAMILTFNAVALMRQQLRDDARVHGIITHGGDAPNIIPHHTRAEFMVRSFSLDYVDELERRLIACAEGAALATGARLEATVSPHTFEPIRRNPALERCYEDNLRFIGEPVTEDTSALGTGSTDFGNVSQVVPGIHAYFRVTPEPIRVHTPEFAEATGQKYALDGMVAAAKALALTGLDLVDDPELRGRARSEFEQASDG